MANRIQIRRNLTSGNAPAAAALAEGELGVNIPDSHIWIGGAGGTGAPVPLLHPTEQMFADATYSDGVAPNFGVFGGAGQLKIFRSGTLGFEGAAAGERFTFPNANGTIGQVLGKTAASTLGWVDQASPVNQFYTIPVGTGADLWEDFNEVDWTGTPNQGTPATAFRAAAGETIYLTFDRDSSTYIFAAVPGTNYGLGATLLTDNSLFIGMGGATQFADQTALNNGTANVAIDPALGNTQYLVKSSTLNPAATQVMNQNMSFPLAASLTIGATNADTGTFTVLRNASFGVAASPSTITVNTGKLQGGATAGQQLTIDFSIIDGGTF